MKAAAIKHNSNNAILHLLNLIGDCDNNLSILRQSNRLGIGHTRLTVRHNGIGRRLTDVHGRVLAGLRTPPPAGRRNEEP